MWNMMWLFTILTILSYPIFHYFINGTAYNNVEEAYRGYEIYSLGAMGYSSSQCQNAPIEAGKIIASCPFGQIGQITSYGVNPNDGDANLYACKTNDFNEMCKLSDTLRNSISSIASTGDDSYVIPLNTDTMFAPNVDKVCTDAKSMMFLQYTCIQSDDLLHEKYDQLNLAVALGLTLLIIYGLFIRYQKLGGRIKALDYDLTTVTAGDFTVELKITKTMYNNFINNIYKQQDKYKNYGGASRAFKYYLADELERRLNLDDVKTATLNLFTMMDAMPPKKGSRKT